ncbi:MAG: aquaporin [Thermoproteota archaeon]
MASEKLGIGRRLLAEFVGSTVLVSAAISPTILAYNVFQSAVSLAILCNAIAVAFVLPALIETLGSVSGCHINPAVTIAMIVTRKMDAKTGIGYILVQLAAV